ncbi:MAG: methyltransferase domain-containing protein [Bacteroidales bacterium]|nr:methyltransferase domain-containing protein [Bacteroidales bacterium]
MKSIIAFLLNALPRPWLIRLSQPVMKVTSILFSGNKVECPVCGGHFSRLLPYGYNVIRKDVLCPRCFSLERHRLLWLFLKNKTRFFSDPLKVLHVAPEQCFYIRFRKLSNIDYTTADLESPLADVKLDIQQMPFMDETFDVVICNHVLEHVPDDRQAMREIYRVLKTGGFGIMQVPTDMTLEKTYEDASITDPRKKELHFRQKDHYRLYGRDYPERIKETGFIIKDSCYLDELDRQTIQRYRLPENEYMMAFYKEGTRKK